MAAPLARRAFLQGLRKISAIARHHRGAMSLDSPSRPLADSTHVRSSPGHRRHCPPPVRGARMVCVNVARACDMLMQLQRQQQQDPRPQNVRSVAFLFSDFAKEKNVSVPAAYVGVILIWSPTPLAINWRSQGAGGLFAVTGRILFGAAVCRARIAARRVAMPWHRDAGRTYLAAGSGIYGAMICAYWGAQYIPSGLISVLFGLTPLATGVLAAAWLGERSFTAG